MTDYRKGYKVNPRTGLTKPEERAELTRQEAEAHAASTPEINHANGETSQAVALYKAGELDKSERLLTRIVATNSEQEQAWYLLGVIAYARQDLERANALLGRALELNSRNADAAYYLGRVQFDAGNAEMAGRCYRFALSVQSNHHGARDGLAQLTSGVDQATAVSSSSPAQQASQPVPPLGMMGVRGGSMVARAMQARQGSQQAAPSAPGLGAPQEVWWHEVIRIVLLIAFAAIALSVANAAGILLPAIAVVVGVTLFVILKRLSSRARQRTGGAQ